MKERYMIKFWLNNNLSAICKRVAVEKIIAAWEVDASNFYRRINFKQGSNNSISADDLHSAAKILGCSMEELMVNKEQATTVA